MTKNENLLKLFEMYEIFRLKRIQLFIVCNKKIFQAIPLY